MDFRWIHAGLLLPILLMQNVASRAETRSAPRLFDVVTAHGIFDGAPVEPAEVFTPEETPIYVSFRCDGCSIGTVIRSSWWYLEREPPLRFAQGSVTVDTVEDFGEFHYELARGKRWSVGTYRIDLRIEGELAAQVRFRVGVSTEQ
jgi:hypothetical protein